MNLLVTQGFGDLEVASLAVSPGMPSWAKGATTQFVCTATLTDGSTRDVTSSVTWASDNMAHVTVSNAAGTHGLATGVAVGTANVTASTATPDATASTLATVTAAALDRVVVAAALLGTTAYNPIVNIGASVQVYATAVYTDATVVDVTGAAAWVSGTPVVATAVGGLIVGLSDGVSTVTATYMAHVGASSAVVTSTAYLSIEVQPTTITLHRIGQQQQFYAIATMSDSTSRDVTSLVNWTTTNPAAVVISNAVGSHGLATAVAAGSGVSVTATLPP